MTVIVVKDDYYFMRKIDICLVKLGNKSISKAVELIEKDKIPTCIVNSFIWHTNTLIRQTNRLIESRKFIDADLIDLDLE